MFYLFIYLRIPLFTCIDHIYLHHIHALDVTML